jgi:CRISPR-associated protein Cmr6
MEETEMPIAAVPSYLGSDFRHASPGMRFGMYLKLWEGSAWTKSKDKPLDGAKRLNDSDKQTMQALLARQKQAFDVAVATEAAFQLDALATAPFTTGLGNEHPLENGFAFLNPYGLPYLPGSGVKGVLRQAARELASGEWGESQGWSEHPHPESLSRRERDLNLPSPAGRGAGGEGVPAIDALFGKEDSNDALRGALSFWDVLPQIAGDSLAVEIMTPHQGHYYQQKPHAGSASPHESGQPNPISFLTVPPNSRFVFHVQCNLAHLNRIAPDLAADGKWQTLLTAAFEHAFQWLGFGAKTAVGYGAMQRDVEAEARAAKQRAEREAEAHRATMTPAQLSVQEFIAYMGKRQESLRHKPTRPNGEEHNRARQLAKTAMEGADWTVEEKLAAAEAIAEWLPKVVQVEMKDERKKLKLALLRGDV